MRAMVCEGVSGVMVTGLEVISVPEPPVLPGTVTGTDTRLCHRYRNRYQALSPELDYEPVKMRG